MRSKKCSMNKSFSYHSNIGIIFSLVKMPIQFIAKHFWEIEALFSCTPLQWTIISWEVEQNEKRKEQCRKKTGGLFDGIEKSNYFNNLQTFPTRLYILLRFNFNGFSVVISSMYLFAFNFKYNWYLLPIQISPFPLSLFLFPVHGDSTPYHQYFSFTIPSQAIVVSSPEMSLFMRHCNISHVAPSIVAASLEITPFCSFAISETWQKSSGLLPLTHCGRICQKLDLLDGMSHRKIFNHVSQIIVMLGKCCLIHHWSRKERQYGVKSLKARSRKQFLMKYGVRTITFGM